MATADMGTFDALVTSWRRALRARNLSVNTLRIYTGAAEALATWLVEQTPHREWSQVCKGDLESWLGYLLDTGSAGHASNQYRAVQQLFRWLAEEDEIPANPIHDRLSPDTPILSMRRVDQELDQLRDLGAAPEQPRYRRRAAGGGVQFCAGSITATS